MLWDIFRNKDYFPVEFILNYLTSYKKKKISSTENRILNVTLSTVLAPTQNTLTPISSASDGFLSQGFK